MLSFSVSFDQNKGIGLKGQLPWHLKEDLALFKKNTLYKNILMGQTTYVNLPRKLTNRTIHVVSNDPYYNDPEVDIIRDLEAFCRTHEHDETEYVICGGASIYRQAYPYCHKAYISFVKGEHEVDTFFSGFSFENWIIRKEVEYDQFIYRELVRKTD